MKIGWTWYKFWGMGSTPSILHSFSGEEGRKVGGKTKGIKSAAHKWRQFKDANLKLFGFC